MTDKLSEAIARFKEPEPTLATRDAIEEWLDGCRKTDDEPRLSTPWWGLTYQVSGIGYVHDLKVHARQIGDPEISMRLLEELLAAGLVLMQRGSEFVVCWPAMATKENHQHCKSVEEAIARAYCKQFGINIEV